MLEKLKIKNATLREALSEFAGTFVLVLFGNAVLASLTFDKAGVVSYTAAFWGWGLAVMLGVLVAGGASGAHLNPAVTVALATVRKFSWRKILPYIAAQYLGAFLAAVVLYITYLGALDQFDGGIRSVTGVNATAGIFASYPKDFVGTGNGLLDQVVGTALLTMAILAVIDGRNMAVASGLQPLFIGLALAAIVLCFGYNCGAPLNPARDLSPRIFTAIAGWGGEVFSFRQYNWFWVPVIGPHIGAIVGAWFYTFTVELHCPAYGLDAEGSNRVPL
uniref:Putative aquaporin major intrinsic protein family n=1 Tax=Amblyomma triste TaxID=251400 RepID=A0A023GD17_AMBTT